MSDIEATFQKLVDVYYDDRFGPHRIIELSGQPIGERTEGVWCSQCQDACAEVVDIAVLSKRLGVESYECDPVIDLVTIWGCRRCQTVFQLPDSPSLKDNRDA